MMLEKEFPIMSSYKPSDRHINCPTSIPWDLLNEEQAKKNHDQTLERLAERGGLAPSEALAIIERRTWKSMDYSEASAKLKELI